MPRIPDEHLRSVAFIYPSKEAARAGLQAGGTGFIVSRTSRANDFWARYILTNEHVVDQGGHWVRVNHASGTYVAHIAPDDWTWSSEGDDLAIALLPLPEDAQPFMLTLESLALTREEAKSLKVGVGDEIYMLGRLAVHGGRASNNPVARFGSIALMPTPMERVRDGRGRDVVAYLVEMRSHSGFSGSPVFLYIPHNSFRGTFGDVSLDDNTDRFRLLGIDTGHMNAEARVLQRDEGAWFKSDDLRVQYETDISIVAPIWSVMDLLEREDLVQEREAAAREHLRTQSRTPPARPDPVPAAAEIDPDDEC